MWIRLQHRAIFAVKTSLLIGSMAAPLLYGGRLSFTNPTLTCAFWTASATCVLLLLGYVITHQTHILVSLLLGLALIPLAFMLVLPVGWIVNDEMAPPLEARMMQDGLVCERTPQGNVMAGGTLTVLYAPVPYMAGLRRELMRESQIDGQNKPAATCDGLLAAHLQQATR